MPKLTEPTSARSPRQKREQTHTGTARSEASSSSSASDQRLGTARRTLVGRRRVLIGRYPMITAEVARQTAHGFELDSGGGLARRSSLEHRPSKPRWKPISPDRSSGRSRTEQVYDSSLIDTSRTGCDCLSTKLPSRWWWSDIGHWLRRHRRPTTPSNTSGRSGTTPAASMICRNVRQWRSNGLRGSPTAESSRN